MKDIFNAASILLVFLLIAPIVNAAGLSMGPVKIETSGLMRGYEYNYSLFVQSSFENSVVLFLNATGSCGDWISLYSRDDYTKKITEIIMPPTSEAKLLASLRVPDDAAAGNYSCRVYAQQKVESKENQTVFAVRVKSEIKIDVIGSELPKGEVRGVTITNPEIDMPLVIEIIFENTGNVTATPWVKANITKNGTFIDTIDYNKISVEPGKFDTIIIEKNTTGWGEGEYQMPMQVYLVGSIYDRPDVSFKILEHGSLTTSYEIVNVNTPGDVAENQTGGISGMIIFDPFILGGIIVIILMLIGIAYKLKTRTRSGFVYKVKSL